MVEILAHEGKDNKGTCYLWLKVGVCLFEHCDIGLMQVWNAVLVEVVPRMISLLRNTLSVAR